MESKLYSEEGLRQFEGIFMHQRLSLPLILFLYINSWLLFGKPGNYPPIGKRVYTTGKNLGEIQIQGEGTIKKGAKAPILQFRDPTFSKPKKKDTPRNQQKIEPQVIKSKVKNTNSIFTIKRSKIIGRKKNPRLPFKKNAVKLKKADEAFRKSFLREIDGQFQP